MRGPMGSQATNAAGLCADRAFFCIPSHGPEAADPSDRGASGGTRRPGQGDADQPCQAATDPYLLHIGRVWKGDGHGTGRIVVAHPGLDA